MLQDSAPVLFVVRLRQTDLYPMRPLTVAAGMRNLAGDCPVAPDVTEHQSGKADDYTISDGLREYQFDGFSVIVREQQ